MPYDQSHIDILNLLSALGAFGQGPQGVSSPPRGFMDPEDILSALSPRALSGLARGGGALTDPQRWGHVVPFRGGPGQFEFRATLPLAGTLSSLPDNAVLDLLRSFNPALSFHAVTPNPWSLPSEFFVGDGFSRRW
jgi:hypothetical protein